MLPLSVHRDLGLLLWACGSTVHYGSSVKQRWSVYLMAAREKRETGRGQVLYSHTPSCPEDLPLGPTHQNFHHIPMVPSWRASLLYTNPWRMVQVQTTTITNNNNNKSHSENYGLMTSILDRGSMSSSVRLNESYPLKTELLNLHLN